MFHTRLLTILVVLLGFVLSADGAKKRFTLVIDAGHGGNDAGAVGKKSKEKTLTLRYALAFGRIIEQNCPDVKVIYTRKNDVYVDLWRRAEIANQNKADLFVSVHINALSKGHIMRGYQTYTLGRSRRDGNKHGYEENLEVAKRENSVILYEKDYKQHYEGFDPNSPASNIIFELIQDENMESSIALAREMQKHICSATKRQNKGVHQDNLCVLRKASMPACLMELGFISTPDEEDYMNSKKAVEAYATGFYNAFVAYRKRLSPGTAPQYKPVPIVDTEDLEEPDEAVAPGKNDSAKAPETVPSREPQLSESAAERPSASAAGAAGRPVFKVQILANAGKLKKNSPLLKGQKDADYYQEGKLYKYTVGASTDYQEIYQLRKELLAKFPQAFIVAFKDGVRVDVNEARKEKGNSGKVEKGKKGKREKLKKRKR